MKLEEFYAQDPRRAPSSEVDFGVMWGEWPHRRVSWIRSTGEVYAVRQNREQDGVEVLGVVATREELERRLAGWPEHCGSDRRNGDAGLGWIRERLAGASVPEHSEWPAPVTLRMLLKEAGWSRDPKADPEKDQGPWVIYKAGPLGLDLTFCSDGDQPSSLEAIQAFLLRYFEATKSGVHPVLEVTIATVQPELAGEKVHEDSLPF